MLDDRMRDRSYVCKTRPELADVAAEDEVGEIDEPIEDQNQAKKKCQRRPIARS